MLGLTEKIQGVINYWAAERKIDPALLTSICKVESNGNPWVARYEPGYRWLNRPAEYAHAIGMTHETEEMLQKTSFGLMQIMGGLARDLRFQGPLPALFDPEVNLNYATLHIQKLLWKYGEESDVIAAYNAGSPRKRASGFYENQVYVDKVSANLRSIRALKPEK
jgi:soluble lytic murein transglycosylase-like protein